jgi:O-antigen ligase
VPSSLRRLATPAMLLAALALIATLSRGGWIELLLSFAIVLLATWRRSGISLRSIALVFGGCLVVFLFLYIPNPVSTRVFADDNGSAQSRIPLMRLSYRMISANPLMGVGANNFVAVMNGYAGSEFRHAWIYTVHNEFLLVCSETGIIGLAVFSWIFLDLVRRAWRLWQSQDPQFAPLGLGIVAAIGGYMLHMTVDIFSERGLFQLIWTLAACIAVCEMILRQDSPTVFPFRKAQKVR